MEYKIIHRGSVYVGIALRNTITIGAEGLWNRSWLIASRREDIIKVPVEMRLQLALLYLQQLVNWMRGSRGRGFVSESKGGTGCSFACASR